MESTDISGFEGDQTGMGQGLAYVLPQSRSVGYFMQLANERAHERRQDALLLQRRQQELNDQYAQHVYNTKTPEIAKNYTKFLQPKFDSLLGEMADYHARTGQDPYTNPEYVKQFNDLSTVAKNTHEANLAHTAYAAAIADKSKNYTPQSKQAGIDWLNAYQKDPVGNLYSSPPQLEQRDLGLNDALKLAEPIPIKETIGGYNVVTPDRHKHVTQLQTILSQPEFAPLLQSNGVNPNVGDVFSQPNGHGGTIYPTDAKSLNDMADHMILNSKQPHYVETFQVANIDPADPHAKDKLVELAQRQNAGYGRILNSGANELDAKVKSERIRNTADERLGLAYERLSLAQEKAAKAGAKDAPTYFQDLSERIRNKEDGAIQEFGESVSKNPDYQHGLNVDWSDPKSVKIVVPAKYKFDNKLQSAEVTDAADKNRPVNVNAGRTVEKPSYTVTLDSTNPDQWTAGFARIYKDITGDQTAAAAKAMTPYGKGHVPGGQSNSPKTVHAQPASKQPVQIKSDDEYNKLPKGATFIAPDGKQYIKP